MASKVARHLCVVVADHVVEAIAHLPSVLSVNTIAVVVVLPRAGRPLKAVTVAHEGELITTEVVAISVASLDVDRIGRRRAEDSHCGCQQQQ